MNDSLKDGELLQRLNEIGVSLSAEHNIKRLIETILKEAQNIANADLGVLFIYDASKKKLVPSVWHCNSHNIHAGGTSEISVNCGNPLYTEIPLYKDDGTPNNEAISVNAVLTQESINIADIYNQDGYDFSFTKFNDARSEYRTESVLVVPMMNKRKETIGVLRLSNAQNKDGKIVEFSEPVQYFVESLASQAAVALDNDLLINGLEELLDSFIQFMAKAIDKKSPQTGNHLQKVPVITTLLTKAACEQKDGPFKGFNLTEDEMYEVHIAAWLHDCGKLSTPDYILEKSKKLESFFDRIELIKMKFEVLRRDAEIEYLQDVLNKTDDEEVLKEKYEENIAKLEEDWQFLKSLNEGAEWVDDNMISRLNEIAERSWHSSIDESELGEQSFFSDNELKCLSVRRGTLTDEERNIIQDHVLYSIDILKELPFPEMLKRVPEYAGSHHEKMNGKGYPNGLKGDEMSIPARIMVIADIFEALTSHDRPYKKSKTLSETYKIMDTMCANGEIDPNILDLLWKKGVYKEYAKKYLIPEQIDDISHLINE